MKHTQHALITGGAGFIGSHLVESLLKKSWNVTVLDNYDPFYAKEIKYNNLNHIEDNPGFRILELDIRDEAMFNILEKEPVDVIIHLAAKAGVRPSISNPVLYQDVNVKGTQNLLELARLKNIKKFIFASSSSVYGINPNVPWKESDYVLNPISPYASTKVSGELLGHVYSHLYGIQFIALRFFTVYGPRQRPDLAIHKFFKKMLNGEEITMFGDGSTSRDYTYVDDVVSAISLAIDYDRSSYEVINVGNQKSVSLIHMIQTIEHTLGKKANIVQLPEQPGDVPQTYADIKKAQNLLNYSPNTSFDEGLRKFKEWLLLNPIAINQ